MATVASAARSDLGMFQHIQALASERFEVVLAVTALAAYEL